MSVAVIIVAAGSGARLGAQVPKAYVKICGRPILEWAVRGVVSQPFVTEVVVVVPPSQVEMTQAQPWASTALVTAGGAERHESVRAGLAVLSDAAEFVLVHDAARPFVPAEVFSRVIAALRDGAQAVIPAVAVTDTMKRVRQAGDATVVSETIDRHELIAVQTPQGFLRKVIDEAHANLPAGTAVTDDASLVERSGGEVQVVAGSADSLKITSSADLALAELLAHRLGDGEGAD
jgi:2-C-methyl-D-erythritol 4-phosphate cytidylyltransferase